MNRKGLHAALGLVLAFLVFCYVCGGDFSWLTLTGPLTLEPSFETMEGPGYAASPALRAIILSLLFPLLWFFFSMIPNLAAGLRRHWRYAGGVLVAGYLLFAYLSGSPGLLLDNGPGAATFRLLSLVCAGIFLCVSFHPAHTSFTLPAALSSLRFIVALLCFFAALCLAITAIFAAPSWLFNGLPLFLLLRISVLASALTAAAAVHSWKKGG